MKRVAISFLLSAGLAAAADLPNAKLTPGATNPDVTQENIDQTICAKGWTKTIRPPAYVTNKLKMQQIKEYGFGDTNPKHYEEDHLIALEIGGDPRDEHNLWPEPWNSEWNAHRKDQLENKLKRMVCDREMPLRQAQLEMARNWIAAYKKYVTD